MKKFIVMLAFALAAALAAVPSGIGLGIIVGEPTGLSAKAWLSGNTAVDAAAGWSVRHEYVHLHADFLHHNFGLLDVDPGDLPFYYGIGGRLVLAGGDNNNNDEVTVGLRVPVGVSYLFDAAPFDLFLEVVPLLNLLPETEFDVNGAIGVRYYFH
jgi:hypothetical protein